MKNKRGRQLAKIGIPNRMKDNFTDEWIEKLNNRYVFVIRIGNFIDTTIKECQTRHLVARNNTVYTRSSTFWVPTNCLKFIN